MADDFRFYNTPVQQEQPLDVASAIQNLLAKPKKKVIMPKSPIAKLNPAPTKAAIQGKSNPWVTLQNPMALEWGQDPGPSIAPEEQKALDKKAYDEAHDTRVSDKGMKEYHSFDKANTYMSQDQYNEFADHIREQPEFKGLTEQDLAANEDIQNILKMPSAPGWMAPLMSLVKAETGKDIAFNPGFSPQDKMKALLDSRDKSSKRKSEMAQLIQAGIKNMISGESGAEMGNKAFLDHQQANWNPMAVAGADATTQKLPLVMEQLKAAIANLNARTTDIPKAAEDRHYKATHGGGKGNGGKILPAQLVSKLSEAGDFPTVMGKLNTAVDTYSDKFGPIAGRISENNPYDTGGQEVLARIKAAKQMVGKYMEAGVLRMEDEKKYEQILPRMADTPAVAKQKSILLAETLARDYNNKIKALGASGYDVSGLAVLPEANSQPPPSGGATQVFKGKTYKLKAGGDKNKQSDWEVQ